MRVPLTALVITATLALAGCSTANGSSVESTPSTSPIQPSSSPGVSPANSTTAMPTCNDLLGDYQLALLDDPTSGIVVWDSSAEGNLGPGAPGERMVAAGGTVCSIGIAKTDGGLMYGFVPTANVNLVELRQHYVDTGYVRTEIDGGEQFCLPDDAFPHCNMLTKDSWFITNEVSYLPTLQERVDAFSIAGRG